MTFGDDTETYGELKKILLERYDSAIKNGILNPTIKAILKEEYQRKESQYNENQLVFSFDETLDNPIQSREGFIQSLDNLSKRFFDSRKLALKNTEYYLSLVNDLDVYVATSMRKREDFRKMAETCERIFKDDKIKNFDLRYFDPTISAAFGHEDKGLIECLMVKCAKVLIYSVGEQESWGKDAEAAMALSLGKPVIFYCDEEQKKNFYKDVHPLSRLIDFSTGVAVGAIVTDKINEVVEILSRIFENKLEYELDQIKPGYYRLKEKITKSIIRLQTNDRLLTKSFWNSYNK
ncbi:MAG: hypothetical protein A2220_11070 [Ignavibacteria bacterium RIFOXYA2_FULL_35_10]|nr:MAG: hypothetical protein A2220_11070 [Ignavibacteria bacterium RIFOXYA2_FULL_35_10]